MAAAIVLASAESYWRTRGYQPTVLDSTLLWSSERDRVYGGGKTPLVLLGASRIGFGADLQTLRQALPKYEPVMLALNGRYPLATLRDLAEDRRFRGVVLCDLDSVGLLREFFDMQASYVRYYHAQWTPSWKFHRWLLDGWQSAALIADPGFGAVNVARRILDGTPPPSRSHLKFFADRNGELDFSLSDPAAIKRHFADALEGNIANMPKRSPDQFVKDLAPVRAWAEQIESRGGRVIFYQSPVKGLQRSALERVLPREQYWDRFAKDVSAALTGTDEPSLDQFPLPDDSHLDFRDKPAYTRALAEVLIARGWIER